MIGKSESSPELDDRFAEAHKSGDGGAEVYTMMQEGSSAGGEGRGEAKKAEIPVIGFVSITKFTSTFSTLPIELWVVRILDV